MELTNYGITLQRLTEDKIELVRNWRNDPKISSTMFFQDYITPEMQQKWFNRVKDVDLYFIVVYQGEEIGLINVKDINPEKRTGETGVFIYEDKYLNTDIAYRAHLVMFDYIYIELNFLNTYSHIRKDNPRASRFIEFLGAICDETNSDESSRSYVLEKEKYLSNKNRVRFINKWHKLNNYE